MSIHSLSRHKITIESGKIEYTIAQIQNNQFDNLDPEILKLCDLSNNRRWCYGISYENINLKNNFLNLHGIILPLAKGLKKNQSNEKLFLIAINISYYFFKLFIEKSSSKSKKILRRRFELAKNWKLNELEKLGGLKNIDDIYYLNSDSILNIEINIISYLTGLDSTKVLENLNIFDKKCEDENSTTYVSKSKAILKKNNIIKQLNKIVTNKKKIELERTNILHRLQEINKIYNEKEECLENTNVFQIFTTDKSQEYFNITYELSSIEEKISQLEFISKKFDEKLAHLENELASIEF